MATTAGRHRLPVCALLGGRVSGCCDREKEFYKKGGRMTRFTRQARCARTTGAVTPLPLAQKRIAK